jgi:hypothetical protein
MKSFGRIDFHVDEFLPVKPHPDFYPAQKHEKRRCKAALNGKCHIIFIGTEFTDPVHKGFIFTLIPGFIQGIDPPNPRMF